MSKNNSPHIYKKGKPLKIKNLDDITEKKEYVFSTFGKTGVQTIANHCNNINQIVARCWLNTLKINHYFGIKKDISINLSKNKTPFNQFKTDLCSNLQNRGELSNIHSEKIITLLENQNKLIEKINHTAENSSKQIERLTKNNQFVEEIAKKAHIESILKDNNLRIKEIQEQIKQLIG